MKTVTEIQQAHDVLVQVLMDETPLRVLDADKVLLAESASVLCWVLGHSEHSQGDDDLNFGAAYRDLCASIEEHGMALVDHGGPY